MRTLPMIAVVAILAGGVSSVMAQDGPQASSFGRVIHVSAHLQPSHEVPAVSSPAEGTFTAKIDLNAQDITYELTFSGLQAPVTQSHIHFAQPNVNGGIMVWLCGTASNPGPAGTQTCPQSGTITGVIHASDIQTLTTQGIATGEFNELVAAIRAGLAYANVHSTQSPGGEIRGQIRATVGRDN
jgi:hypothetical protein